MTNHIHSALETAAFALDAPASEHATDVLGDR